MITLKSIKVSKDTIDKKFNTETFKTGEISGFNYRYEILQLNSDLDKPEILDSVETLISEIIEEFKKELTSIEFTYEIYDYFSPDGMLLTITPLQKDKQSEIYINETKTKDSKRELSNLRLEFDAKKETETIEYYKKLLDRLNSI